ncbi:MAG: serine/threonine-protein kinase, partial [Verrucomicrobiota bacterium]
MSTGTCEVCGGATDDGKVCRACLLGNVLDGDEGLLELPEELGGFRILERIGRGSSGEVWRAFQPGPDREVALKVFLDHRLGGSVDRTRFLREAQSLGKLDHPGIVPVYATGEEGGFLFIASRWMSGGTLEKRVSEGGFVGKEKETVEAMIQVVRAVAHAHQHGLVHRDIKPANILIDHKGAYCLADFGIAISEREAGECEASGTPAYMAPEIWAGEPVTTASDIWALGALMFEMLTGRLPRDSREALPGELDPRIRAIISQCLENDPSARYAGASSLLKDLESFLSGRCVEALKEGLWMRLLRWSRRRPGLAIMSLIGLLLALTAGILGLNNWRITRENERRSVADAARFRQHAYVADVYLASRALADNQLGVARAMLDRHVPAEDERDLRGFEWHAYASLAEGDESQVFTDHDGEIRALAYDPSGRYLLSGSRDARVMVRDLKAGELVLSLPEADAPKEAGEIPLMAMLTAKSPEAKRFLLSGAGKVDELRMRARPSRLGEIMCAAWSHDGTKFVTGGGGSFLRIWSFPEGKLIGFLPQYP